MRRFTIKNFERFQHYKVDEAPKWIKLYRDLLTDYEFQALPDVSKSHLMLIWLLYSQVRRPLPYDPRWIALRIGATDKVNLDLLAESGFVALEQESESALERSENIGIGRNGKSPSPLLLSPLGDPDPDLKEQKACSQSPKSIEPVVTPEPPSDEALTPEQLVEGWNEICGTSGLPRVIELSGSRRTDTLRRLREHPQEQWWETVLNRVAQSPHCRGLSPPKNPGDKPWKASFDWLIKNDTNALKVYEGKYNQ